MMPIHKSDVIIVGAGLIGSALSLWLAKHTDLSITLIERAPLMSEPVGDNTRVVALGRLATDFLEDINIFATLSRAHCYPYQKMMVWDENSNGELAFDASSVNEPYLGHMIDSQMCVYQLQQYVSSSPRIQSHFDVQASRLELSSNCACVSTDVDDFETQLVVAADGSRSWVRQQAKIFANHQSYGQSGIVTKIETDKSHQDCAWQCFLSSGPVAILPLAENQSSIVWSADDLLAKKLMAMSDDDFSDALGAALQGRLGAVKVLSKRQMFPLVSLRAETYYKRNLVLIGDAAHSIHPLAGQGANLGFKDALALGRLLASTSKSELGSPRRLSAYQRMRQPDNNQTDSLMSALHGAYKFDFSSWMHVRGLGMNFVNDSDFLCAFLARQAMGL